MFCQDGKDVGRSRKIIAENIALPNENCSFSCLSSQLISSISQNNLNMNFKLISSVALFLVFSITLQAQISVGFKGSFVKAWEDYGDTFVPEGADINIEGGQFSLILNKSIGKNFQVGVEPGIVRRGAACEPGFIDFAGESRILYNYLELPVMFGAKFPLLNNRFEIFGKCGYGAAYAVSAKRKFDRPNQPNDTDAVNFSDETNKKRWDHGAYGSFGFGWNVWSGQIFLEGTYYHAMMHADTTFPSENRSVAIGVGFLQKL